MTVTLLCSINLVAPPYPFFYTGLDLENVFGNVWLTPALYSQGSLNPDFVCFGCLPWQSESIHLFPERVSIFSVPVLTSLSRAHLTSYMNTQKSTSLHSFWGTNNPITRSLHVCSFCLSEDVQAFSELRAWLLAHGLFNHTLSCDLSPCFHP